MSHEEIAEFITEIADKLYAGSGRDSLGRECAEQLYLLKNSLVNIEE